MVVVSFHKPTSYHGWQLLPGTRYVMSEAAWRKISADHWKEGEPDLTASWSHFASYERRANLAMDLNGRRIAVYRESGYGDNLMVTGLVRWIKARYPDCSIDHYAGPAVAEIWAGNPDVRLIASAPTFEAVRRTYDAHIFLEGMIENDTEPDQANAYDNLLSFVGEYPPSVPVEFKRPQITWTEEDERLNTEWLIRKPEFLGLPEPYILVQWNASLSLRTYPFELMRRVILGLAETMDVVVVGETRTGSEKLDLSGHGNIHDTLDKIPSFRALLPMIRHASAVLCPDSGILHAAAIFPKVPVVSLWGPYAHADRARYYPNQHEINAHDTCPSSPCRAGKLLPDHKCRQAQGYIEGTPWCSSMLNIAPEKIIERVLSVAV